MGDDKMKLPQFDGHWDHWSEVMENFFRAKGLWSLIDRGIDEPASTTVLSEEQRQLLDDAKTNDHKVKHYLYQSIDRITLEQILDRKTSKAIWDSMKGKFRGNDRVKKSLLQCLRREFELLEMKETENVEEYFKRVLSITNQMRSNGEIMNDSKVVEKILRTLSERFVYMVVSIEESKDIEAITLDELQSSLAVHEQKFKRQQRDDDQALAVTYGRGMGARGRNYGGRGRGRGRGRQPFNKSSVECYKCHKFGHFRNECPLWEEEANHIKFDEEMLLMAYDDGEITAEEAQMAYIGEEGKARKRIWFLDSGCSNHMSGNQELFITLNNEFKHYVKLGNGKRLEVRGKGNVRLILNGAIYVIDAWCVSASNNICQQIPTMSIVST